VQGKNINMQTYSIEQKCISKGVKMTDQRRIIARVISQAKDHPHVEEIYLRASKLDSNISLATVYRTVSMFEGYGIIEKLDFQDGKARYEEKISNDDHHHHLIDLETGQIIEFQDNELEALKERIAQSLGYKLVDHRLELYGIKIKK
jgi:Fur family ferric uptake transcriptional regulator